MAEEYDVQAIMNALKAKEELDPDQHDGCYELMRETIEAYWKLDDFSILDYRDLNLVYLTTVGTWKQGVESKKKTVNDSHLMSEDKEYLSMLWDEIWDKAGRGEYSNYEMDAAGNRSIGLFGTGFFTFQKNTTDTHAQAFIKMCVDILTMTDDNAMYDRASEVLTSSFKGMKAASASMILHCLKPSTFPVLNSNMGNRNIFEVLGVDLEKKDNLETYIDNCRRIKVFRDKNFSYKNYRIFDMAAWKVKEYVISHPTGQFGSWEIVGEDVARKNCDKTFFENHTTEIPQDICWFFRANGLQSGRKQELVLVYDGFEFDGYMERESISPAKTILIWDSSLAEEFELMEDDMNQYALEFRRDDENRYELRFVEASKLKRAWLITWNKNNWYWQNFDQKCEGSKTGETFVESWACANSNPQAGDEVFLIKLGEKPRGIIGHGFVNRPIYEKTHYDATKAEEGKKEKAIDVVFDRLINYEHDKFISQDELDEKCPAQYWSPQSSGIEIKPEVLPTLRMLWNSVTSDHNKYGFAEMVSFLRDYSGEHYTVPDKAGQNADYMAEMKRRGQEARQKFILFIQEVVKQLPGIEYVSCSNWLNQGQVVERYLWAELKNPEWKNYPQSISISLASHDKATPGEGQYLSIRADTRDVSSKAADYEKQKRLLDCDLTGGMSYMATYVNGEYDYLGTDKENVKRLCDDGTILKLEIIETIDDLPEKDGAGTIMKEAVKAAKEIQALYEYVMSDSGKPDEADWWPSLEEYDPGITADEYIRYFSTESIVKRAWVNALYELYLMPNHMASCKQLGDRYGYSPSHYISYFSSAGQNIQKVTGIGSPEDNKNAKCWPILFQGKNTKEGYCYKLREPVFDALSKMMSVGMFLEKENGNVAQFDHNLILYGPPGTGKTYNAVIYAVSICEGKELDEVKKEPYSEVLSRYRELKEDGRIAFTTFHQSYGYEEFIEGIKPRLNSENESLGYTIEDGVFKAFCKRAGAVKVDTSDDHGIKANPHIWGLLLGGTGSTEIKQDCIDNNVIRFGWDHITDNDVVEDNSEISKGDRFAIHQVFNFIYSMEVGDIVIIAKNITTIDAIGVITGEYEYDHTKETHSRTRKVKWLIKNVEFDIRPFLSNGRRQLPTSYLYPLDYLGIDNVSKILDELNEKTEVSFEPETKPFVFIIDEVNRGNISKIFGELITLIEETKRAGAPEAMEATLPYSGEPFSVPSNVYILGTMNTADRSIALMDTALRRRFEFTEMMPDSKVLESLGIGTIAVGDDELNVAKMLDVINERIEYLFDREHTIGHAFFTKLADDPSIETLADIFQKNVIPLLQEYFYEDYEKIQLVLGDNSKEDEFKFILDRPIKVKDIFNGNPDIDLPEKEYTVQHEAFLKLESYKQIGKDL